MKNTVRQNNKHQTTIVDISRETKYSIATVSRALNNGTHVSSHVKKKILETAQRLNYIPNIAARNLVQGKSKTIGLVSSDSSPLYSKFIKSFSRLLEKKGYVILSLSSDNSLKRQQYIINSLQRQQVDALAISPIPGNYESIKNIIDTKIPIVIFNRFIREFPVDSVDFDFRPGTKKAIDILVSKGRKHFYQLVRQDIYSRKERRNAFQSRLVEHKIPYRNSHTLLIDENFESGYEQMKNLIKSRKKVDVVFCSSDFTALGVIRCCFDYKIKVPEDVSVVGAYNNPLAKFVHPRISSINTNFELMSKSVVELILKKLSKGNQDLVEHKSIQTTFLERETT